jgi:molybdate transport system regulatory protein
MNINGRFWIEHEGHPLVGHGRIELLEHIRDSGSINEAAKTMKMAYKAAWDAINAINSAAQQPVVQRNKGGRKGGGTQLTPYGRGLIEAYRGMERAHQEFLIDLCKRYPIDSEHIFKNSQIPPNRCN